MAEIRERLKKDASIPPGTIEFGGLFEQQQKSFHDLLVVLAMAYGIGSGADMLRPLAIAVMGAVCISVLFSLIATPTLYRVLLIVRRERGPQTSGSA